MNSRVYGLGSLKNAKNFEKFQKFIHHHMFLLYKNSSMKNAFKFQNFIHSNRNEKLFQTKHENFHFEVHAFPNNI